MPQVSPLHALHRALVLRDGLSYPQVLGGIVVLGILATLAVVRIGDIKERSYVLAMMSDLRGMVVLQEQHFDRHAEYAHPGDIIEAGWVPSKHVALDSVEVYPDYWYYRLRHAKTSVRCSLDYEQGNQYGADGRIICPGFTKAGGDGYSGDPLAHFTYTIERIYTDEGPVWRAFARVTGVLSPDRKHVMTGNTMWACYFDLGDGRVIDSCATWFDIDPASCEYIDNQGRCYRDIFLNLSNGVQWVSGSRRVSGSYGAGRPSISITGNYLVGEIITFDATESVGEDLVHDWDFGDGTGGHGQVVYKAYSAPGTYRVRLAVTDEWGATGTTSRVVRIVAGAGPRGGTPRARVTITPAWATVGEPVTFDGSASTDPDGDPLTFSWTLSDGFTSTEPVFTHTFDYAGSKTAWLTVTDPNGNWSRFGYQIYVRTNEPAPSACFTGPSAVDTLARNVAYTFDAGCSANAVSYLWAMGDGTVLNGQHVEHQFLVGERRTVHLWVTDAFGRAAKTSRTYTLPNTKPVAVLVASADTVHAGTTVTFSATDSYDPDGDGLAFHWSFSDGWSSGSTSWRSASTGSRTFTRAGTYVLSLRVTDPSSAWDTASHAIVVRNGAPTVTLSASKTTAAVGETVLLSATAVDPDGDPLTYTFEFGNGSSRNQPQPSTSYSWAEDGSYTVHVNVTDGFGSWATASVLVVVGDGNRRPVANFDGVCNQETRHCTFTDQSFDPDGTIAAWSWAFGAGAGSSLQNPTHTFPAAGTYYVALTVTDNQGKTQVHGFNITFVGAATPSANQAPDARFSFACQGGTCSFTDQSVDPDGHITAWRWSFGSGQGGYVYQQNPTHTFSVNGTYTVELRVTDNAGAPTTKTHTVEISDGNMPPVPEFSFQCQVYTCQFTDLSFDPDGAITGWQWNFGPGNNSSLRSPTVTFSSHGSHTVTLRATDNNGVQRSRSRTVTIVRPDLHPVLTCATPQGVPCAYSALEAGLSYTFFPGYSYSDPAGWLNRWSLTTAGATYGSVDFLASATHTFPAPGTYTLRLDVIGANNTHMERVEYTVQVSGIAPPVAHLGCYNATEGQACGSTVLAGSSLVLDGSYSYHPTGEWITEYQFDTGSGNYGASGPATITHQFNTPGTYTVRLRARTSGSEWGSAQRTFTVVPQQPPSAPESVLLHRRTTSLDVGYVNTGTIGASHVRYEIALASDPGFVSPVAQSAWQSANSYTAPGLLAGTGYLVRAMLRNSGGESAWGPTMQASTLAGGVAEAPSLTLVGRTTTAVDLRLSHQGPTTHAATTWQVTLASDPLFLAPVHTATAEGTTGDVTRTTYANTQLIANTSYLARARVRATSSTATTSDWSESVAFTTNPVLGLELARYVADDPSTLILDEDGRVARWRDVRGYAPDIVFPAGRRPVVSDGALIFDGTTTTGATNYARFFASYWSPQVLAVFSVPGGSVGGAPLYLYGGSRLTLSVSATSHSAVGGATASIPVGGSATPRAVWACYNCLSDTRVRITSPGYSAEAYHWNYGGIVRYDHLRVGSQSNDAGTSFSSFSAMRLRAVIFLGGSTRQVDWNLLYSEAAVRWGAATGP
jgi:PKD repeat protein